jgi:hippurate hydrolase
MGNVQEVLAGLDGELGWIRDTYQDLHRNPELSLEEHRTARVAEEKLTAFGFRVLRLGGTGVVGVLENGAGPVVLARADMDALPVTEATGLPYSSAVPGVMHACGHDVHVPSFLPVTR